MALSDKAILDLMRLGNISIEPFDRANLSTSSYDVRLGEWYFTEHEFAFGDRTKVYNIWSEGATRSVWGEAKKAKKAKEIFFSRYADLDGIFPDDQVILLGPGETILGHTQEFIGGVSEVTTKMQARSTMGRNFIEVCKCAGWGDVGFCNRWTMEITNNSRYYSIPLVVGRRIAQIVFFRTGPILGDDYTHKGKYQTAGTIEEMRANWSPDQMLPKLYLDREIKK